MKCFLALAVMGIAFHMILPRFTLNAARALGERPGACLGLGLGLAALFTVPAAAVLLMMTLVGLLLRLALLGLYLLLLLAGFLIGVLFVGDRLLRLSRQDEEVSRGKRVLSLVAAFLLLWLVGFLPVLGGLAAFLLLVLGMGALVLHTGRMYKTQD